MGPGSAAHHFVLRSVRGTRLLFNDKHGCSSSRPVSPEFCFVVPPSIERGRREDREPVGSHGPPCQMQTACASCIAENRATRTSRPSLRGGWNGLCRALPGERCTIAPVALRMADAANPVGPPHHRKTWRTGPRAPGRHDLAVRGSRLSLARRFRSRFPALRSASRRRHPRPPPPGPRSRRSRYAPLPWAGVRALSANSEFR